MPRYFAPIALTFVSIFFVLETPLLADSPDKKAATGKAETTNKSLLTIDRIYKDSEFGAKSYSAKWLPSTADRGASYLTRKPSQDTKGFQDIVRVDARSGDETVLVTASDLVPPGQTKPLRIDSYQFDRDQNRLLVFTNSKRVWRGNTRGDYWVLDRSSRQLTKLGGGGPESTMMFAKFSPDGKRVAYVRERNIYVEDLFDHTTMQLTHSQSIDEINGTTDWVYEEELGLRDAFQWSPDGQMIAFWQLNTSGVERFSVG